MPSSTTSTSCPGSHYRMPRFLRRNFILPLRINNQLANSRRFVMKRAVIITGPGFQDHDVIYSYYRLREEGYQVDEAPDRVRQDMIVLAFVKEMDALGKVVGGLCHGPWIMISAQIMRGRNACAYIGMVDDMRNSGANIIDADVITDRNMVTCSYYGEVGKFMQAVFAAVEACAAKQHQAEAA